MLDDKTKLEILNAYQRGINSIQSIARIYRVSVDQVLEIIGEENLGTVTIAGDLIDASEAGPGAAMNYGRDYKVPFSVD